MCVFVCVSLAQEYMAKIIEGGRGRAGQTRRGQQLLVGL